MVVAVGAVGEAGGLQPRRPAEVAVGPGAPAEGTQNASARPGEGPVASRPLVVENGQGTRFLPDRPEGGHDLVQGLVPGHLLEPAPSASAEGGR